jgi:hypothetical protein
MLLQAEAVLASLAGCERLAVGAGKPAEQGDSATAHGADHATMDTASMAAGMAAEMAAAMSAEAPCHSGGALEEATDTTQATAGNCTACDLNCGSLMALAAATGRSSTYPSGSAPAVERTYDLREGAPFPALRPPIG